MSLITKLILGLIVTHLIVGFGWLVYKLSPRKNDGNKNNKSGSIDSFDN